MQSQGIDFIQDLFYSRLVNLDHLMKSAQTHFGDDESFIQKRIVADMVPFGTQIAFTCSQPHNFALWCDDKPMSNLDSDVSSLQQAYQQISNTKEFLASVNVTDEKLNEVKRIDLDEGSYLELPGRVYVNDFLIPNFYFHLVTAYDILRMAGVPIGKRDYMTHLAPFVRQE